MAEPSRWRRIFRFSLSGLLFVTLCVCGYFGSYRVGERSGAQDLYDESFFVKTYNIDDLLIEAETEAERDKLYSEAIAWIHSTVDPESWTVSGEQSCYIFKFPHELPTSFGLVVAQYGAAHDKVELAIKELRRRRLAEPTHRALGAVELLADHPAAQPVVLVSYPRSYPRTEGAVANRFADLTDELTQTWGAPSFVGKCTDRDFPSWSPAQSIAVWSQGDGQVYLAVQDRLMSGQAVVAGWHGDD